MGTAAVGGGAGGAIQLETQRLGLEAHASDLNPVAVMINKAMIENGSLAEGDTLFWDEPESNLNPKLIRAVAAAILGLCNSGIQVIIASHSLFLLRELEILASRRDHEGIQQRHFALERSEALVTAHQGNTIDDVDPVVMLDEDLLQSDRFMALGNS